MALGLCTPMPTHVLQEVAPRPTNSLQTHQPQVSALIYCPMGLNQMAKATGIAGAFKVTKKLKPCQGYSLSLNSPNT